MVLVNPVAAAALLALFAAPFAAHAGPTAATLFAEGRAFFADGDYVQAAYAFEAAYRIAPHPSTMFNAAQAWQEAEEPARSADAYELALETGLSGAFAEKAQQRLASLKRRLAQVTVTAPSGTRLSVEHLEHAPTPARFHLEPGRYTLQLVGPSGERLSRAVAAVAGEDLVVPVTFAKGAQVEAVPQPPAPAAATAGPAPSSAPASDAEPQSGEAAPAQVGPGRVASAPDAAAPAERPTSAAAAPPGGGTVVQQAGGRPWPWIVLGGAVLLSSGAVYTGIGALRERDSYFASDLTNAAARARSSELRAVTNALWVGAAICASTGAALLLTGGRPDGARSALTLGPSGVSLVGAF